MKIFDAFHRFFETATWRRQQARVFARERFGGFDCRHAAAVLDCLVETLGVNFEQLHPDTDLAKELGADEDEPEWISSWLEEELRISISPSQVIAARTVGALIHLLSQTPGENAT